MWCSAWIAITSPPAEDIDPEYARLFHMAREKGVEVLGRAGPSIAPGDRAGAGASPGGLAQGDAQDFHRPGEAHTPLDRNPDRLRPGGRPARKA